MRYRPADGVADLEWLVDAWCDLATEQQAFESVIDPDGHRAHIRQQFAGMVVDDTIILAHDSDRRVGFVSFYLPQGPPVREDTLGVVDNIYVVPDRRNEGIGSELLARAESALSDRGVTTVELEVMSKNTSAVRLYRRSGYRDVRLRLRKDLDSTE